MKKYFVLTSVLALAACGGGSGGGSAPIVTPVDTPVSTARIAMSGSDLTSNQEITKMASEILIATDGSPNIARAATTTQFNGKTYTAYRLDDVKFFSAEQLGGADSYLQLELNRDTGRIEAIQMDIGGEKSGRTVRSETDTTLFEGPIFEYISDSDRADFRVVDSGQTMADLQALETKYNLSNGHWNRIDERMDVKTLGGDIDGAETQLQYSDFGHFNPVYRSKNRELTSDDDIAAARARTLNRDSDRDKYRDDAKFAKELAKEDYQLFAGGYAIEGTTLKDTLTPEHGAEYTGKAIGRVYASIDNDDGVDTTSTLQAYEIPFDVDNDHDGTPDAYSDDAGHDISKAFTTSHAHLTINNDGTQVLFMPFNTQSDTSDKFYDVTLTLNADGNDVIGAPVFDETTPVVAMYAPDTAPDSIEGSVHSGFYGIDTASEAAGTARYYTEKEVAPGITREWEVQAAWGMKKDN